MSLAKTSQNAWFKLAFFTMACLLACVFGLISITGNPILIGLAVGSLVGIFLLAMPKKTIGMVMALGLITPALLDIAGHGLSRMLWAISMMALLLWLPGLLNLVNFNHSNDINQRKYIPLFIWLSLAFVIFSVINTILQLHSIGQFFWGFKRYFQTFGLILALATFAISRKEFDQWLKLLLGIALLQLPFALFERLVLVPMRGGIALGGGQATDIVAGTMGANLDGGSPNSIMVTFVLIAFAFVFSRWKSGLIDTSRLFLSSFILLLPLVLGETKVVIIMLPILGLVLIRKDMLLQPGKYIPVFGGILLLSLAFAYLYFHFMLDSNIVDGLLGILAYNVDEKIGYGTSLLNRSSVITFWAQLHGWHDPIKLLFGSGIGSSYGDGYNAGHIASMYPKYGIGLTALSTLLWDLGVAGLILYISIFIAAWVQISKTWRCSQSIKTKADCLALQAGISLTLFFIIYSDSQLNLLVHQLIIAIMLGYAAFLYQEQRRETYPQQANVRSNDS